MLQVRDLRKSYRDGDRQIHVLQGLNMQLAAGQCIAIMGPSGCGKSTLISCLAGLSRSDQGSILFSGEELTHLPADQLTQNRAANIGVIFQQFHLIPHLTALENVRLPLDFRNISHTEAHQKAKHALQLVGLDARADHFPNQLSRGECQRVAIARVLVTSPKLVLADEPTASLDRQTGREIIKLLIELSRRQKAGLVIVTHDQEMAAACDQRYHFTEGQLRSAP
ncbi:MAG: ABC transporter ATP-binding protein [Bdellovibrionales bacterium]